MHFRENSDGENGLAEFSEAEDFFLATRTRCYDFPMEHAVYIPANSNENIHERVTLEQRMTREL